MFRYLFMNFAFMFIVGLSLYVRGSYKPNMKRDILTTILVLVLLTLVFNNIIIGLNIVAYNQAHILGIFVGKIPIEDFFYAILAGVMVPLIWEAKQ